MRHHQLRFTTILASMWFATLGACANEPSNSDTERLDRAAEIAEDSDIDFDIALELVDRAEDGGQLDDEVGESSDRDIKAGCTVLSTSFSGKIATAYATGNFNECRIMCSNWSLQLQGNAFQFVGGSPTHTCYVLRHLGF
jgi:hypothetical protein